MNLIFIQVFNCIFTSRMFCLYIYVHTVVDIVSYICCNLMQNHIPGFKRSIRGKNVFVVSVNGQTVFSRTAI